MSVGGLEPKFHLWCVLKVSFRNIFCEVNPWREVFTFCRVPVRKVMSSRGPSLKFHLRDLLKTRFRNIFFKLNPRRRVSLVLGVPVRKQLAAGVHQACLSLVESADSILLPRDSRTSITVGIVGVGFGFKDLVLVLTRLGFWCDSGYCC
jgi:hypothetical protein